MSEQCNTEARSGRRCWECRACGWQLLGPLLNLAEAHCLCGIGAGMWFVSEAGHAAPQKCETTE